MVSTDVRVGQVLNGRYQIDRPLGSGGQASLYYAVDRRITGKSWALKVYSFTPTNEAEIREQWRAESDVLLRR
ncbi:MAG TPA: hypothetical protein VF099_06790, partial [Ktedonobacterales bacterium]